MLDVGIITPVKAAFGEYLKAFYDDFVPDTKASQEWARRTFAKAAAWADGRMVDFAEEILSSYRRNDNTGRVGSSSPLPFMALVMDKGYTPIMGDLGVQMSRKGYFTFPTDAKSRVFQVKVMRGEIRTQVVIFAVDDATARGIAAQLCLYLSDMSNRTFFAMYKFAGIESKWPTQIQTPDVIVSSIPHNEQTNLTILTVDITLRASMPLFYAPKVGEPNDGLGTVGDANDPSGFKVVDGVNIYDGVELNNVVTAP